MQNPETALTIHLRDDGESINFRRQILKFYSAYFAAYIDFEEGKQSNLQEDEIDCVTLDAIPGWAVKASLKHLQSSYERLSGMKSHTSQSYEPHDLYALIVVSDYFQMESLKNDMIKELILMLDVENFFTTLKFAIWWQLGTIEQACCDFLIANFADFYRRNEYFRLLPLDILTKACGSDQITCEEVVILSAIVDWLQVNHLKLSDVLIEALVACIRYAWISIDHINQIMERNRELITHIHPLNALLEKAIIYHKSPYEEQRSHAEENFNKPRLGRLSINQFSSLNETLKCYYPTSKSVHHNHNNLLSTINSSNSTVVAHSSSPLRGWLHSHPIRVVRTYQQHSVDSSSASPISTPIDMQPRVIDHDLFANRLYFGREANTEESELGSFNSVIMSDSRAPGSSGEILGHGMFCPNDGVFYVLGEDFERNESDMDS